MRIFIIFSLLFGLAFFGYYQQSSHRSAAICVYSTENAFGEIVDERYLMRFGEGITHEQLRKATRDEYSAKYPTGLTCDASFDYPTYDGEQSHMMDLNGGYYTVINNGKRPNTRIIAGFGDTPASALANALKKLAENDEGWSEARNGYSVLKKGEF